MRILTLKCPLLKVVLKIHYGRYFIERHFSNKILILIKSKGLFDFFLKN